MDRLNCGVSAVGDAEALGRNAYRALCAQVGARLDVVWHPPPGVAGACDLLVLSVDAGAHVLAASHIEQMRRAMPACSVIVLCSGIGAQDVASLLGAGAFDFVCAPYRDGELGMRVERAAGLLARPALDARAAIETARAHDLIGSSTLFVRELARLPVTARSDASVLILGETGTGKEMFARAIHYLSPRAARGLVAVNCGAIPVELMESELFGCARGAYTSAHVARSGLVREAEGGTLFLDEIDALPLGAQTKLLRFLQEMEYRPVGSDRLWHADVRVIAASNHDVAALVEQGAFRRDLYFRLNVLNLNLPALRERAEDVPALAYHFAQLCCRKARRPALGFTARAMRKLLAYDWPGNVRELYNVIERAALFCAAPVIDVDDLALPEAREPDAPPESFRDAKARSITAFERDYIERLLATHAGNITQAATAARKNRRAFFELMRKHAIAPERFREARHGGD
ncbi:MAG TPA: sigma-54 dependent transcriptional regulator [Paraburkholderia sp.]|uniref:sigma-54 interaction domain-containing protein n=1 Tax=Paraburkholderia sp. TaxID=1926495 RepID=UPI002D00A2D5|nr:sigma-54 dependent transcriptional regulator [Paraburkholderia sp.]HTR10454.1 sigma-54 dependent transcriptional regulator [Paraburkholderia sp.]